MKKVLVACEESQRVATELRALGIEAYSCDLIEPSGGHLEYHVQGDVIPLLKEKDIGFCTMDGMYHHVDKWDLIIAFPPCTYLTCAANRYYDVNRYGDKAKLRLKQREQAIRFFMEFVNAPCEHIAIENPIGVMSTNYRKPDQIIQPYEYGHPVSKKHAYGLKIFHY